MFESQINFTFAVRKMRFSSLPILFKAFITERFALWSFNFPSHFPNSSVEWGWAGKRGAEKIKSQEHKIVVDFLVRDEDSTTPASVILAIDHDTAGKQTLHSTEAQTLFSGEAFHKIVKHSIVVFYIFLHFSVFFLWIALAFHRI